MLLDAEAEEARRGQQEQRQQGLQQGQDHRREGRGPPGGDRTKGGGVAGPASIGFEYAWRAKLHKNAKYIDEQRVEERLAAAAAVVRERYLPGVGPADDAGAALARARAILEAYAEATSAGG